MPDLTVNGSTEFSGINAGKLAFVDVRGTWDSCNILVQTKANGTYTTYATNGTQTANFAREYRIGSEDGLNLQLTSNGANTALWAQVVEL